MATITQRQGKGGIRYTAQIRVRRDGEQYTESRTFDSKRSAERWAAAREKELEKPGAIKKASGAGLKFSEVIQKYMDDFNVEYRYGRSKFADLKRLKKSDIGQIPAESLVSADYVDHIRARIYSDGCQPSTAIQDISWFRVVIKAARPAWGVDADPKEVEDAAELCKKQGLIDRPGRRERRPTIDELNRILTKFDQGRYKTPMVDIVLFGLFSGRRQEEITLLRWDDLDGSQIIVRDMKDPKKKKGNHIRVQLTDEALAIIERQPKRGDRIFPYNPDTISANFTRACQVLGITGGLCFHSLRHECASWLFERHWQIPQVAMVTGHKSWQTLQRYTHLSKPEPFDKYDGWEWRPQIKPPSSRACPDKPQASQG